MYQLPPEALVDATDSVPRVAERPQIERFADEYRVVTYDLQAILGMRDQMG